MGNGDNTGDNARGSIRIDAVVHAAQWIDRVLWAGLCLCTLVAVLKLTGSASFVWQGVEVETALSWVPLLGFTLAHVYVAIIFVRATERLWEVGSAHDRIAAYDHVTAKGGLFVRGMSARVEYRIYNNRWRVYDMSLRDPTTYVAVGSAVLVLVAVIPFQHEDSAVQAALAVVGVAIAFLNWRIGAVWITALSALTLESKADPFETVEGQFVGTFPFLETGSAIGIFRDDTTASGCAFVVVLAFGYVAVLMLALVAQGTIQIVAKILVLLGGLGLAQRVIAAASRLSSERSNLALAAIFLVLVVVAAVTGYAWV